MRESIPHTGKLRMVKTVHTVIYLLMVAAIFYTLYAGITQTYNAWLWISLAMVTGEGIVFYGNGQTCPLTTLAKKYGDPKGYVGDTFFPERCTQHTFNVFGSLFALGVILLLLRAVQHWL